MSRFRSSLDSLRRATEGDPAALARLRRRLDTPAAAPPRATRPILGVGLALAAALLVGIGLSREGEPAPEAGAQGPAAALTPAGPGLPGDRTPLASPLTGQGERALTADVQVQWTGAGVVGGVAAAPLLRWEEGSVRVSVTPDQGIALSVHTDEAAVSVHGTIFSVERSALGTHVAVERGEVGVRCVSGVEHTLGAGRSADCAPVRAAPLLRRARALQAQGQPAEALTSIEAALGDPERPALLEDELRAVEVGLLFETGRGDEALAGARRYLAGEGARRAEVAELAAAHAEEGERCAFSCAARPGGPTADCACDTKDTEPTGAAPALRP